MVQEKNNPGAGEKMQQKVMLHKIIIGREACYPQRSHQEGTKHS